MVWQKHYCFPSSFLFGGVCKYSMIYLSFIQLFIQQIFIDHWHYANHSARQWGYTSKKSWHQPPPSWSSYSGVCVGGEGEDHKTINKVNKMYSILDSYKSDRWAFLFLIAKINFFKHKYRSSGVGIELVGEVQTRWTHMPSPHLFMVSTTQ